METENGKRQGRGGIRAGAAEFPDFLSAAPALLYAAVRSECRILRHIDAKYRTFMRHPL
jgi:hypothetical protein